jgi:glucan phosphoethanolaminetransferase (alkaline phosphatase superfamily)
MIRPERPAWEIFTQKIGYTVLAVPAALGSVLVVWKLSFWRVISQTVGLVAFLVTFIVFALVFYMLFEWLFRKRPDEIARRVPTPSKELRRKTKQFFDNLPK